MKKKVTEDRHSDKGSCSTRATSLVMHNLIIFGHRTTVRLEDETWTAFKDIAEKEGCTLQYLASRIYSRKRSDQSFTSAIRVFVMLYYRDAATEAGDPGAAGRASIDER